MSVFTKKVQIVWNKVGYGELIHTTPPASVSAAEVELNAKTAEMVANNKMADETGVYENGGTITVNKKLSNSDAADEWLDFNTEFASKYGFTMISSKVFQSTI